MFARARRVQMALVSLCEVSGTSHISTNHALSPAAPACTRREMLAWNRSIPGHPTAPSGTTPGSVAALSTIGHGQQSLGRPAGNLEPRGEPCGSPFPQTFPPESQLVVAGDLYSTTW